MVATLASYFGNSKEWSNAGSCFGEDELLG